MMGSAPDGPGAWVFVAANEDAGDSSTSAAEMDLRESRLMKQSGTLATNHTALAEVRRRSTWSDLLLLVARYGVAAFELQIRKFPLQCIMLMMYSIPS